jgi:DNA-binding CsgD family transcriptional regulator
VAALLARTHIGLAQGELEQAGRDAHEALAIAARTRSLLYLPEIFECLARLAATDGGNETSARVFAAADAIRHRTGVIRFPMHETSRSATLAASRDALGEAAFDIAWAEGAALSVDETIAYLQRGYGRRKRPSRGWESLTPTETAVLELVRDGLANNDIAARLFISRRTVQTHLTHIYTKLGITSRIQLIQEAARHV